MSSDEHKSDLKGIEGLVYLCYGTTGVAKTNRERGRKLLEKLRREDYVPRDELMKEIGLDPESESDNDTFNNCMSKMRGDNKFDIQIVENDRNKTGNPYWLSFSLFSGGLNSFKAAVKYAIEESPQASASDKPEIMDKEF